MNLKKTYQPKIGYTKLSEIGKSSMKMLEFGMIELNSGDSVTIKTEGKEYAFLFLYGHADVKTGAFDWKKVGGRDSVFSGAPQSIYVPRNSEVTFTGCEHVQIAVIDTPTEFDSEAQWLKEDHVKQFTLGEEPMKRDVNMVIDERCNARHLTVGESFVIPANWAGFPGHKHDVNDMPKEAVAEEIYFFLFRPENGFGIQCLYTADAEIDETWRVKGNDFVEFPKGYHLTGGVPGYETYILWLMAGEEQGLHRTNDPEYEWVLEKK